MNNIIVLLSSIYLFVSCKSDIKNSKQTAKESIKPKQEVIDSITINDTLKLTEEEFYNTESFKKNSSASEQYQKMMSHFKSSKKKLHYPNYYGGSYINDANEYVVLIKGNVNQYKDSIFRILGSKNVILKPCKFSYAYLTATMDTLNHIMKTKPYRNCTNFYIDEIRNCIMVGLQPFDEKHIKAFQQIVTKASCIQFEEGGEIILE